MITKEEYKAIGERLYSKRKEWGMTQEAMAEQCDLEPKFYGSIERGDKGFSVGTLMKLSKGSRLTTDYILFGDRESMARNPEEVLSNCTTEEKEFLIDILYELRHLYPQKKDSI